MSSLPMISHHLFVTAAGHDSSARRERRPEPVPPLRTPAVSARLEPAGDARSRSEAATRHLRLAGSGGRP